MKMLALINGKLYVRRGVFAQAALAVDGVIRLVGTTEEVLTAAGDGAQIIDCGGKAVLPGLNDSHQHLHGVGVGMYEVDIASSTSVEDMIRRVKEYMKKYPERCRTGIHAVGWNQDLFTDGEKRMPTRHDLDQISTEIPIVLERVCGHIVTGNSKVIELLHMTGDPDQFPGGTWEKDPDGSPNGLFTENACLAANAVIPPYTRATLEEMFLQAADYAVSCGLTSVQSNDAGTAFAPKSVYFPMLKEIYDEDRCLLRYRHQISFDSPQELREFCADDGRFLRWETESLKLGPLKLYKDGSLGARTAMMKQGYLDDPGNYGVVTHDIPHMDEYCKIAAENGMQVVTHVIGDLAIEDTVTSYEKLLVNGKNPLRHGLIHCQITDMPLLQRISRLGILALYQPIFLDYDMHAVMSRCGAALSSTSYAFKTAEDLNIPVSYGTDSPVEDMNPFPNIYSAVTRKDKAGWPQRGFFPQECVDVPQAIDAYTIGSAYVEFREHDKGRIQPGYLADFTVLDTDIFTCDPMAIRDIHADMTIIGGDVAFER